VCDYCGERQADGYLVIDHSWGWNEEHGICGECVPTQMNRLSQERRISVEVRSLEGEPLAGLVTGDQAF
jgi:hypothetical protein